MFMSESFLACRDSHLTHAHWSSLHLRNFIEIASAHLEATSEEMKMYFELVVAQREADRASRDR